MQGVKCTNVKDPFGARMGDRGSKRFLIARFKREIKAPPVSVRGIDKTRAQSHGRSFGSVRDFELGTNTVEMIAHGKLAQL